MDRLPVNMHATLSVQSRDSKILDFNEARDDEMAEASAGPSANNLYLTSDR